MNYSVGNTPNYNTPVVDFAGFFGNNKPQQLQSPGQGGTFMDALKQFLSGANGQQMLAPGSAVPGASGPTSAGGPNGPAPLMASGGQPMMDNQGRGLY